MHCFTHHLDIGVSTNGYENRLIKVMRVFDVLLEKPLLYRQQWRLARECILFCIGGNNFPGYQRKFRNTLVLKNLLRCQLHTHLLGSRYNLNTQNGITTKLKKIVIYANLFQPEHFTPNLNQYLFYIIARCHVSLLHFWSRTIRGRQGMKIHFTIWCQW